MIKTDRQGQFYQMSYFIHRTLNSPFNVLNILAGRWIQKIDLEQYLLNLHTSFEVYTLVVKSDGASFRKIFMQNFMAKVYFVCSGPNTNGNCFFAMRDNDIVQMDFSESENIFIARVRILLPNGFISPCEMYFENTKMFISSSRGGVCIYDFSQNESRKPIFCAVCAESALFCFPFKGIDENYIGRIENGPSLALYNFSSSPIQEKITFPKYKITCAFCIAQNTLAICTVGEITFFDLSQKENKTTFQIPIIDIGNEDTQKNDFVIQAIHTSDDTIVLLTSIGKLLLLQNFNITFLLKEKKISKIFPLNEDYIFLALKGIGHKVYNIRTKKIVCNIQSTVGSMGLYLGSQAPFLAPHSISYYDNILLMSHQGVNIVNYSSFEFPEPIFGLYSFSINNKSFVIVSFSNSSRLFEVISNELRSSDAIKIKESVQTIGICSLINNLNETALFQLHSKGFLFQSSSSTQDQTLNQLIAYSSNSKQLIMIIEPTRALLLQPSMTQNNKFDNTSIELQFSVNTVALSFPDSITGMSDYVVYGAIENQSLFSVKMQTLSTDRAARMIVFDEPMPAKVSSIKFFDSLRLVIGLENGLVVVGKINRQANRLENVYHVQFGSGSCLLTSIPQSKESLLVLVLHSRPMLVQMQGDLPRFRPLAINSMSHAASLGERGIFLLSSNKTLYVSTFASNPSEITTSRFPMPGKIIAISPFIGDRFLFVALTNMLIVFDCSNGSEIANERFPGEQVKAMTLKHIEQMNILIIASQKDDEPKSLIRMYSIALANNLSISQPEFQIIKPTISYFNYLIQAICFISDHTIIAACSGGSLLCLRMNNNRSCFQIISIYQDSRLDTKYLISASFGNRCKPIIFVGDASRSVKMFRFHDKTKEFKLKYEEGYVRKISSMDVYNNNYVCGGDANGNVFILEYPHISFSANSVLDKTIFSAERRLTQKLNFSVGDSITGVHFTSNIFNCLWYSTISGGLGCFISAPHSKSKEWHFDFDRRIKLLRAIELEMSTMYYKLCNSDHIAYRYKLFSSSNIIDMDLIEIYIKLCPQKQEIIARRIAESFAKQGNQYNIYATITPLEIEHEINRFRNYFMVWNSVE